jgi:hypothetical protein
VAEIQAALRSIGRFDADASGSYDAATRVAIEDFAGEFNLENRLREDDQLSQHLVNEIRDLASGAG